MKKSLLPLQRFSLILSAIAFCLAATQTHARDISYQSRVRLDWPWLPSTLNLKDFPITHPQLDLQISEDEKHLIGRFRALQGNVNFEFLRSSHDGHRNIAASPVALWVGNSRGIPLVVLDREGERPPWWTKPGNTNKTDVDATLEALTELIREFESDPQLTREREACITVQKALRSALKRMNSIQSSLIQSDLSQENNYQTAEQWSETTGCNDSFYEWTPYDGKLGRSLFLQVVEAHRQKVLSDDAAYIAALATGSLLGIGAGAAVGVALDEFDAYHSATQTMIFSRNSRTPATVELERVFLTSNHGTAAGEGRMRFYSEYSDGKWLPTYVQPQYCGYARIQDGYEWSADCRFFELFPGHTDDDVGWGPQDYCHVCSNDTFLQIYNTVTRAKISSSNLRKFCRNDAMRRYIGEKAWWYGPTAKDARRAATIWSDPDKDGIVGGTDNCPDSSNPNQEDFECDFIGNVCDVDWDNDFARNESDSCPYAWNPDENTGSTSTQPRDIDHDGVANSCDPDMDGDGIVNSKDNCPRTENPQQRDLDHDYNGDACDDDIDGDGIANEQDNCPETWTEYPSLDMDGDVVGDACDDDIDGDGIANADDNCPMTPNRDGQNLDYDRDGLGDACDSPTCGDGIIDAWEDCDLGVYDVKVDCKIAISGALTGSTTCQNCRWVTSGCREVDQSSDSDRDGVPDYLDNCPFDSNRDQTDADADNIGDVCDQAICGNGVLSTRHGEICELNETTSCRSLDSRNGEGVATCNACKDWDTSDCAGEPQSFGHFFGVTADSDIRNFTVAVRVPGDTETNYCRVKDVVDAIPSGEYYLDEITIPCTGANSLFWDSCETKILILDEYCWWPEEDIADIAAMVYPNHSKKPMTQYWDAVNNQWVSADWDTSQKIGYGTKAPTFYHQAGAEFEPMYASGEQRSDHDYHDPTECWRAVYAPAMRVSVSSYGRSVHTEYWIEKYTSYACD